MNDSDSASSSHTFSSARPVLSRVFGLVRPFRGNFWLVNVLTLLIIAAEVVEVRLIGSGFKEIEELGRAVVAEGGDVGTFWSTLTSPPVGFLRAVRLLAIVILVLALLRGMLRFANRLAMSWLGEKVIWRLRSLLFGALQRQSFAYYDRNFSGQLINRVTGDVQQVRRMVNVVWFTALQTAVYVLGYFVLMLTIHPLLAVVSMATVPICVWQLFRLAGKLRVAFHEMRDSDDDMVTALQENIAGVEVVKAFAREKHEIAKFEGLSGQLFGRVMTVVDLFRTNMPVYRALVRLNLVLALGMGGMLVMGGGMWIADLVVFTMAVNVIGNQLRQVLTVTHQGQEALASSERIFEILDARPDVEEKPGAQPLPAGHGHVRFEGVTFGYDPGRPILHEVTLEVEAGEVIAVVGPTGAGKSTMLNLLPRFYDPDGGRVVIDGIPVDQAELQSLRQSIGLVFQETFLFSDTAANNIAFGVPDVKPEEIVTAARIARAHEFIDSLQEGYDTVIGERGVTLSGGQQQRLAIARAIVKDPRILILDDAMASVDSATEHEITADLDAVFAHRTVFIVAHRLSSVKRADRVVVIEDGRITAVGAHDELMRSEGHYREMARLQLGEALVGEIVSE